MPDQNFDRTAYDNLLQELDKSGEFAEAQTREWQPDVPEGGEIRLLGIIDNVKNSIRKDKDTGKPFPVCKPYVQIVGGDPELEGKTFPLDRFGFSSNHEVSLSFWGQNASALAGETITSPVVAQSIIEKAAEENTVFEVKGSTYTSKSSGKSGVSFVITGVASTGAEAAAADEAESEEESED